MEYKMKMQMCQGLQWKLQTPILIGEKIGNTLELRGMDKGFLFRTLGAQELSLTINKWDHMKLKGFSRAKGTIIPEKRQTKEWWKHLCIWWRINMQNTQITQTTKHQENKHPILKKNTWGMELNKEFPKDKISMSETHLLKCSTPLGHQWNAS